VLSSFSASSVHGRGAAVRLAAVVLVSGVVAVSAATTAGAAVADELPQSQGGATATIGGLKASGAAVIHEGDRDEHVSAGLFEMSVDNGGTLQTYGVDIYSPAQKDAKYQETPWSGTSLQGNRDAGRIRWILQNSYPQVNDLAALAAKAGARGLSEQDAAAGTQVAIWRYSDDVTVDAVDPQAEKLADYLHRSARDLAEPAASLSLDPPAVSGHPGELLGPVTVRTNAGGVTVTPPADATSGVKIVGRDGKEITSATDGGELYFDVPEDASGGSAALTVQASTTVPVGRAFAAETRSQTQILAGSSESTVSAAATANWAGAGAIPALSAEKNCAESGLDVSAVNEGDKVFTFELMGSEHTVEAGTSQTVTVPLQEGQPYDFTVEGPGSYQKRFQGVLDCQTQSAVGVGGGEEIQTLNEPSPATVGGASATTADLADTGTSSVTPVIAGVAIGLVLIGGAAVLFVRKKKAPTQD